MGRGILLAGVPGVEPAHIAILGGGVVGANAARIAAGFGANVTLLDVNMDRLRYLDNIMPPNVTVLFSDRHTIREQISRADLVIGAVLVPGAKAPCLVGQNDLKLMKPGSVVIDVAVDQGGCFETTRPTTHSNPTFTVHEVLHYCVANMPGSRRPHQHLRLVQRHVALGAADRQPRAPAGRQGTAPLGPRHQRLQGRNHPPTRGQDVRNAVEPAVRISRRGFRDFEISGFRDFGSPRSGIPKYRIPTGFQVPGP